MTGRDVPTQEKALSVALSVIMVLSVVAIGGAALAGSAGATTIGQTGDPTGDFAATPADTDATDSEHVLSVIVDSDLATEAVTDGGSEQLDISYSDTNINLQDSITLSEIEVELVETDGTVSNLISDSDNAAVDTSGNQNQLQLTLDDGGSSPDFEQGDIIRIVIGSDGTGINNGGASETSTVDITPGNGIDASTKTLDVGLGSEAPIQVSDTSGGEFHY
jgi:surface glycoprotein (TIGR04207 family)